MPRNSRPSVTIETDADVAAGLKFLRRRDPRLAPIIRAAGTVPLRRLAPGFAGLARIVVGQQLSAASAAAIWSKLEKAMMPIEADTIAAADPDRLRAAGLSGPKIRTLKALSQACLTGLPLGDLGTIPAESARSELVRISGIGPWTADIYLLFCLGHPDIFPAGDLALQNAAQAAFGYSERPDARSLATEAELWSPWRGVAARLFWAYWHSLSASASRTARRPAIQAHRNA